MWSTCVEGVIGILSEGDIVTGFVGGCVGEVPMGV